MAALLKVLGVDPGSRSTGWGIVIRDAGRYRLVAAGSIRNGSETEAPERLVAIYEGLKDVIQQYHPDCAAIESIFSHKSSQSALKLGQARGVALLAFAQAKLPIHEYNAMIIKSSVAGSGRAEKEQVQRMVKMLIGTEVEGPHDTADAIAIAITHHASGWRSR
jgi:crossover junction endodeoxyribonuclease RuvC